MIEKVLMWLMQATLSWVLADAQKKLTNLYKLAEDEKEFDKINQTNVEKYNAAKDRLDKIKAAADLLNRAKS